MRLKKLRIPKVVRIDGAVDMHGSSPGEPKSRVLWLVWTKRDGCWHARAMESGDMTGEFFVPPSVTSA